MKNRIQPIDEQDHFIQLIIAGKDSEAKDLMESWDPAKCLQMARILRRRLLALKKIDALESRKGHPYANN